MIDLRESDFIAKGCYRSCYRHPDDSSKCIKIFHTQVDRKVMDCEVKEMNRMASKKSPVIIPKYYGQVETNKGIGHVFSFIADQSGNTTTLKEYLLRDSISSSSVLQITKRLHDDLLETGCVFTGLHMNNVMVVNEAEKIKFAVIDGLGEKTFIKTCSLIPYFARKRMKRKWRSIYEDLNFILESKQANSTSPST